jgi:hypothetical protein
MKPGGDSARRRSLRGLALSPERDAADLALIRQSERRKRETAGSALARVHSIAADPHIHRVGAVVAERNLRDHACGGRPRAYPDWCLVLFGACIRVFGSASATARALSDQLLWSEVVRTASHLVTGADLAAIPAVGPNRDHWGYFLKSRLGDGVLDELLLLHSDMAIERAREVGLLDSSTPYPAGAYQRDHVVGIDGKVFTSPLRSLEKERVDRATGLLRPVRQDPARGRYGEGGVEGIVWGTKFAIASVRSPLANHRVILGLRHFDSASEGGEGRVFTELAEDLAARAPGIHAFTADGAWRGAHLERVQSGTGCGVVAPPRRLTARNGGITIGRHSYAAQPLPWSPRRAKREAECGGHQLWAAAGTLFEQVIQADGTSEFLEVDRRQTKRDITHHKDGTTRHQFYARYTLHCMRTGHVHSWWEPLLSVAGDAKAKFNRTEYLRVVPATTASHARLYGMRQDTESLNAQLERAFYGQRLPAWGVHNQTAVVLLAAFAENSWARAVWTDELNRQAAA